MVRSNELYVPISWFVQQGVFPNEVSARQFMRECNIVPTAEGYPIFGVMRALREISKRTRGGGLTELDQELKREKIQAQRISNMLKMKELISRQMAVDRMRTTLQAVANKVRYAIKTVAPRLVALTDVHLIENILVENHNIAMEHLENEAKSLESWEVYGLNIQPAGERVVTNPEENTGSGSCKEDSSLDQNEPVGQNRPFLDSLLERSDQSNREL